MDNLAYDLRSDGVLYDLEGGVKLKVQGKSASRVRVSMQRGNTIIPPETGDLGTSVFRNRLVEFARERFGEVNGLAEELGLIAVGFEEHLEEREQAARENDANENVPELAGTPYRIAGGGFVRLKNTREGEVPHRLTNFLSWITEEVVRDDGAEVRRIYRVKGRAGEKSLPEIEVPSSQFAAMNWVPEGWGLSARITAGQGSKDYAREAIELYSAGAPSRHLFAHTGWRETPGGDRVYLHAGGGTGGTGRAEGVEVELEPGLQSYALPDEVPSPEELAEAVRESLRFMAVAPHRVTAPLLGAAYLAPLSEMIAPDFALWPWGPTGSFKSTLAALVLSHFGEFSESTLPLSFESTANAQERSLFLLKDTLAVVDDFRPAVSRGDASEMDKKAQRLLRAVGNRQGRGRMTSDTALRRSYPPRGAVIATGETLPEGPAFESAAARALSINLSREDVDQGVLSELQRRRPALSQAMAGYVAWIGSRYERLAERAASHRAATREALRDELDGSHPRTPDAAAALITAFTVWESYARNVGALDEETGKTFLQEASAGVMEAARAHTEATKGGDPASRFVEILRSLFEGGRAYVKDKESGEHPPGWAALGWEQDSSDTVEAYHPRRGANFVGWAGEIHLYLDREGAYAAVAEFAGRGSIPFGIKPRALWGALKRTGISLADEDRADTTARIEGKSHRVIQLPREAVFGGGRDAD